ncbi:MAG: beta-galactosidase [Spongiibacteraceae bacterium]|nr:beta-galactosidase [Spongiibacteraceae bacterium]
MSITRRQAIQLMTTMVGISGLGPALALDEKLKKENTSQASDPKPYGIKKLYHGAAYYPELWPPEDVVADIAEMKKLGINVVRMGEFAWSTMEPNEGRISLDYFWVSWINYMRRIFKWYFAHPHPRRLFG